MDIRFSLEQTLEMLRRLGIAEEAAISIIEQAVAKWLEQARLEIGSTKAN